MPHVYREGNRRSGVALDNVHGNAAPTWVVYPPTGARRQKGRCVNTGHGACSLVWRCDCVTVCRPFLNASKRELLADCALPVSVLIMSFFGSYVFRDVKCTSISLSLSLSLSLSSPPLYSRACTGLISTSSRLKTDEKFPQSLKFRCNYCVKLHIFT